MVFGLPLSSQGALYVPDEISAGNPSDICQSLAKGASLQGIWICTLYTCDIIVPVYVISTRYTHHSVVQGI